MRAARRFAGLGVDCRDKRQRLVKPAQLNRAVDRRRGRHERQLHSVALRALVERHQQLQTRGVDEGQAAQIEDQAVRALDAIQRVAQRLDADELAAGLHDRHSTLPLHFDGERLRAGDLDRASGSGAMRAVG
ncbi:MAG TPA: hypothetical protein VFY36_05815 [Solirubrobacteraceae bacterium]|nr:hypothetical protein [Solirubrobacteraceae bacterium]